MRRSRRATSPASPGQRRALWIAGVLALISFVILATWVRLTGLTDWEKTLVVVLAAQHNLAGDAISLGNRLGNLDAWALVVAAAAVGVGWLRGARAAVLVALSFAVDLLNWLFKLFVARGRPEVDLSQVVIGLQDHGFPSGHAARAAALAGVLVFVLAPARWRLPVALAACAAAGLAMGYARIAIGVHFPLDVVGGSILGLAWFAVSTVVVLRERPAQA